MRPGARTTSLPSSAEDAIVFVVDDDPLMRAALSSLFHSVGLRVEAFASATELLQSPLPGAPSCLVVDIRLPRLSGLDLQAELRSSGVMIPIVFITGHGDIPMSVKAMRAGAINFLTKPFRDQEMLDAVREALERDRRRLSEVKSNSDEQALFASLAPVV
jgi:FixJ family two-component response regulator